MPVKLPTLPGLTTQQTPNILQVFVFTLPDDTFKDTSVLCNCINRVVLLKSGAAVYTLNAFYNRKPYFIFLAEHTSRYHRGEDINFSPLY